MKNDQLKQIIIAELKRPGVAARYHKSGQLNCTVDWFERETQHKRKWLTDGKMTTKGSIERIFTAGCMPCDHPLAYNSREFRAIIHTNLKDTRMLHLFFEWN